MQALWKLLRTGLCLGTTIVGASGQNSLSIYSDNLDNGFQDWSWAERDLNNTTPVHAGVRSMSVTADFWEAASFYHPDFDSASYVSLEFWAHGGSSGGQRIQVYAETNGGAASAYTLPGTLPANTWQLYNIPLTTLGVANRPNVNRFNLQLRNDGTAGTFYLDDVRLVAQPTPALVSVSVQATQELRTVDQRHFGVNLTMWDNFFDPPNHTTTISLVQEMGTTVVRMPGGSLSDEYHWGSNTTLSNTWQWAASFGDMIQVTTNVGAQAFVVVNYGSGTPEEAAAWVRHANITNQLGFKYWEIGNECYGTWERDTNALPNHAHTYAVRASNYLAQMRAADPTIKIGVVAVPGESSYANGYTDHPAYNARTGQTNYGWTPVMLTTLKNLGVTPDFLIHHHYPQWTDPNNPGNSPDNDATLLLSAGNWEADAADLRQQITDYYGAGGEAIELVVTENNADAGAQGRQSTSLVNGLYYAESLGRLLQTEFNSFVWWDLRNGTDNGGFFGPAIYGWRNYGDLGMVNGLNTRHPTFYAAKLMQWFARAGDKILNATSDYSLLSAYAARRANGSMSLLVVNKYASTNFNTQITFDGFTPAAAAAVYSYGIPNDDAARTNGPAAAQDITTSTITNAAATFSYSFPPYSLTVLNLIPTAPHLAVQSEAASGQFIFQLQGQFGVPYVIESSPDMSNWNPVATNTLTAATLAVTNSINPGLPQQYWRAVWKP